MAKAMLVRWSFSEVIWPDGPWCNAATFLHNHYDS